jgi:hypothetical protein
MKKKFLKTIMLISSGVFIVDAAFGMAPVDYRIYQKKDEALGKLVSLLDEEEVKDGAFEKIQWHIFQEAHLVFEDNNLISISDVRSAALDALEQACPKSSQKLLDFKQSYGEERLCTLLLNALGRAVWKDSYTSLEEVAETIGTDPDNMLEFDGDEEQNCVDGICPAGLSELKATYRNKLSADLKVTGDTACTLSTPDDQTSPAVGFASGTTQADFLSVGIRERFVALRLGLDEAEADIMYRLTGVGGSESLRSLEAENLSLRDALAKQKADFDTKFDEQAKNFRMKTNHLRSQLDDAKADNEGIAATHANAMRDLEREMAREREKFAAEKSELEAKILELLEAKGIVDAELAELNRKRLAARALLAR